MPLSILGFLFAILVLICGGRRRRTMLTRRAGFLSPGRTVSPALAPQNLPISYWFCASFARTGSPSFVFAEAVILVFKAYTLCIRLVFESGPINE